MERLQTITKNNFNTSELLGELLRAIKELREEQLSRKYSYYFYTIEKRAGLKLPPSYKSAILEFLRNIPYIDIIEKSTRKRKRYMVVVYK